MPLRALGSYLDTVKERRKLSGRGRRARGVGIAGYETVTVIEAVQEVERVRVGGSRRRKHREVAMRTVV